MAVAPRFEGPDGVLRQQSVMTTTVPTRFFVGTVDAATVDMRVRLRGAVPTSDPDLISFEGTRFTVPNPSAYPEGLQLLPGTNAIEVESILANGSTTPPALVTVVLSQEADLGVLVTAPTGIFVERFDRTVAVTIDGLLDTNVVGYHVYASPQPGGGDVGYFRVDPRMLSSGTVTDAETALATLTVDVPVTLDSEGFPAADPLFFRMRGTQEDKTETVLHSDFDEEIEVPETAERLRVEILVKNVRRVTRFTFVHDRQAGLSDRAAPTIPHSALATVPMSDPLYYVATAVHVVDGVEFESAFSPEVVGNPLTVTTSVGAFPQVSRQRIVQEMVASIYRSQPQIRVDPGSALRDTVIDPVSTEIDRVRFLVDFLHNSQSFVTLMAIDDPSLSGTSVPVSQSSYKRALKQAFYLTSDTDVQTIIDNCFDKLASNVGVVRDNGKRARGEVTFYLKDRPSTAVSRSIGTVVSGGSARFVTTSSATITSAGSSVSFGPATGRWAARAFLQAVFPGASGNLSAGQIRIIENNTLKVEVVNEGATFGGTDRESNHDLAVRAMGVLSSVDSGTLQGYTQTVTGLAGVRQAHVVEAGNALMMRDKDATGRHVGGKVDVWVRGRSVAKVTDAFAFTFDTALRVQFEPVGDLTNLRFRAVYEGLSTNNPIIELLHVERHGLVFENKTEGYVFDVTDAVVVGHDTVELSSARNDPTMHDFGDEIRGSFRFRTSTAFVLTRQPVVEVVSLTGSRSGLVPEGVFHLYRAEDPLEKGRSAEAGDYIRVVQSFDGTDIPSGDPVVVTGERHVMVGGVEYLNNLGADPYTIRIYDLGRTVEYAGPFVTGHRDFTLVEGDETTPIGIKLTDGTFVTEGQTVIVDYSHDENFVVEYRTNAVVSVAQGIVEKDSHITADVLVKWAVEVPVDVSATVVLEPNQSTDQVNARIRTALARHFDTFALGTPLRQADIIGVIESVDGVAYPIVPLTRLARGDKAPVIRESLASAQDSDSVFIAGWSSPLAAGAPEFARKVAVHLLKNALQAATTDGGGPSFEFRGVFRDETRLVHHEKMPNAAGYPLRGSVNGAFVIGATGANVPGYSDDTTIIDGVTLSSDPDEKATEILRIRKELTAGRVVVSASGGDPPTKHAYTVTYVVTGDTSTDNIETGPIEYLVPGNFEFVFDEAPKRTR